MTAKNNRTLRIGGEERESLMQMIDGQSLIHGDLFDVLPTLPDGFANLIIVDPPYNLPRNFGDKKFTVVSPQQYEEYLRSWFSLLCDKLAPDGTLYMCGDWRCSSSMQRVIEERLTILNRITWQREKGRGAAHNWKNSMEDIWFATCGKDYTFHVDAVMQRRRVIAPYRDASGVPKGWEESADGAFRNTFPSNFWDDISIPYWSMAENTAHPTQKPEKLLAKLILASSDPGAGVLDPFAGSGSTAVTAKKLGRHYIGVEQNPRYCVWSELRLERAEADKTIQGYADGVFWERNTAALQKKCR